MRCIQFVLIIYLCWLTLLCQAIRKGRRFEIEKCDEIIPHFIDHISQYGGNGAECDEVGHFPKPGDCTSFFKCFRARGRILPFLEYCAIGYTFDGNSCVPSKDSTDCPQFNCNMLNTTTELSSDNETSTIASSTNTLEFEEIAAAPQISQNSLGGRQDSVKVFVILLVISVINM